MGYGSDTIASAGVVKSFAWSDAVETSGSAALVCSPPGIAGCRGPHTVAMQAPSSISLKCSLSLAELGAPATLPALVYCHKIRRMVSNQVDDTSNLYFKLSTPISSAAVQTVMDFELVDADDGHDAVRLP
ncbi:hypothetical protein MRX96_044689 [Rhipicephalus microplus]